MTEDKGILIRNIYYMLAYAFQELRQNNYAEIEGEAFDDIYDLFAEILTNLQFVLRCCNVKFSNVEFVWCLRRVGTNCLFVFVNSTFESLNKIAVYLYINSASKC